MCVCVCSFIGKLESFFSISGNCTYYLTEKECIESKQGDRCVWAFPISSCMSEQDAKSMNLNTKGDICNPQEGKCQWTFFMKHLK